MEEYEERTEKLSVPKNVGTEGFIKTLRTILSLPRVQRIEINAAGEVIYDRIVKAGEGSLPPVDFSVLEPWAIIRNGELEEMECDFNESAPIIISRLFNKIAQEGLVPVAFVVGANTNFWDWHLNTAGVSLSRHSSAYGLPLLSDRSVPDHSLILSAAYTRGSSLSQCHRFIAVGMHAADETPTEDEVQIL
jgi:hypothetical protein